MLDTKALAAATAAIVREHVEAATASLLAENKALRDRLDALEACKVEAKDIIVEVSPHFEELLTLRLASLPGAKDGRDGIDGKDADPSQIKAMVDEAFAALPIPERGEKGETGKNGRDGIDGRDGKDGAGIADLLQDHEGNLIASFTDGRMKNIGPVRGKDGCDGSDGKDGVPFGPDNLSMELLEDGRTVRMAFAKGQTEYVFNVPFPAMIYRGVYREDQAYQEGDVCTWGGSLWHANKSTSSKPDAGDWTMCVKKGRDGKDGR